MQAGTLVANRFEIERQVGAGGMSRVFVARDRLDGARVAVKLGQSGSAADLDRFMREARVLSELRHPHIVRYVAHGATASGDPYLAMQWLVGHDLSVRLAASGLTAAESLALVLRVAEGLAVAHARGIVHRDIKPSNVFLLEGRVDQATLIDFGIARVSGAFGATRTGTTVGTPGYMAPEQVRGERELGPAADVFSLGCLLFECLTGRPVFLGEHPVALLAKILLADAPRVSEVLPSVPPALDRLIAAMMARNPADRPADAAEVVTAIRAVAQLTTEIAAPPVSRRRTLTTNEQRLMCVVLADLMPASVQEVATLTPEQLQAVPAEAKHLIAKIGASLEVTGAGALVVTPSRKGSATEQAWQAARSALALRSLFPDAAISMATARTTANDPTTNIVDRAAHVLCKGPAACVRVDEATAGLLADRFDLRVGESTIELVGEREEDGSTRTLLGRPTPCVGRERELSMLHGLYEQCVEESVAQAAVLIGEPGVGKSRLRHELLGRLGLEGEHETWIARGDPMGAGAPFGLVAQALRSAAGISERAPIDERRRALLARVARTVEPAARARVATFLAELIGAPFDDTESEQLRAARANAVLMGDQMSLAFQDFLESTCRSVPVVLMLEDLHWGDAPSAQLVDAVLRHARDLPLFVVAFARPSVRDFFPGLWAGRRVTELSLGGLPRGACEKLARTVLGKDATAETVRGIVEHAGGNAFYLEELIRAVAEGGKDSLPNTILAMAESRLSRLDPESRRVLRAASVFGTSFSRDGVAALLVEDGSLSRLDDGLHQLADQEVIFRPSKARADGDGELVFRHALLRDAAYATLTAEDRKLGHLLAAEWLEARATSDARTLAEHFEKGGQLERAAAGYRRAAEQALERSDPQATRACAERALACGASGLELAEIRRVQADAQLIAGENLAALESASAAIELFPPRSEPWFHALAAAIQAADRLARVQILEDLVGRLGDGRGGSSASAERALALSHASMAFTNLGDYARAGALLAEVDGPGRAPFDAPGVALAVLHARGMLALGRGDVATFYTSRTQAAEIAERVGDLRGLSYLRLHMAYALVLVGRYERAEPLLREAIPLASRCAVAYVTSALQQNLGLSLERLGRLDEALAVQREAFERFRAEGNIRMQAASQYYLASLLLRRGDLAGAEREAREAVSSCGALPPSLAEALSTLASVLLRREGGDEEALRVAEQGMQILTEIGSLDEGEPLLRLVHAKGLMRAGRVNEAREALAAAARVVRDRADRITIADWRESYLANVEEVREILELAAAEPRGGG